MGVAEKFFKSHCYDDFLKNGLKSNFLEKFYKRFPCKKWRKFFIGDFHVKLKVSFEFFTRDFPGKKMKWKKFLKGFLWKIEAGEKNLKGFPFKFTPWLVLHVLHFIGDFFYTPALVLHVLHLKGIFLIIKGNFLQNFLWSPLSTVCESRFFSRVCIF